MSSPLDPNVPDRNLALELVRVTESAAMGAAGWIGRGDKNAADGAAVDLMRRMINTVTMQGVVVIGEGEKDEAPMLFNNERVGAGFGPEVDVAVDPLEGTRLTALGIPGSISVIAVAERGSMFFPGAALYMEKIAVGPEAADAIDLSRSPTENVQAVAAAKGMRVSDLTVVVLERDRHDDLIAELRASGARVNLIRDGDVAPSIAACQPSTGVDMLMGIGGTPEGVISAAAIKCMGGAIQGRLWPRNEGERTALVDGGFDLERVLSADDLVSGDDIFVAATGVTGGSLLRGVRASKTGVETESIVMRSRSGTVRRISAFHPNDKLVQPAHGGVASRPMAWDELYETARAVVADDKGILAADESTGTIAKRFDAIGVESTEETRRAYRNLLFTTAGMEQFIGGVILYDETIRQRADDGTPFAELLAAKGVVPGHQGRHRREADGAPSGRARHRRPRRAPRAPRRVLRARRALREVARRDHDRRRHPDRRLHPRQRARAGALRGALPGSRARADRRARGADGRRQHDRDVRGRHRAARCGRSTPPSTGSTCISAARC